VAEETVDTVVVEGDSLEVEAGGFEQVPHWILFHPRVTANALRLYLVLRSYAMGKGMAFPSRKTLARAMAVSLPTLDAAKQCLISVGAVGVSERRHANGNQTTNLYHVRWSLPEKLIGGKESLLPPTKNLGDPLLRNLYTEADQEEAYEEEADTLTLVQKPVVVGQDKKFDEFWETYPRKENKAKARVAWSKVRRRTAAEVIIEGAARYRDDPNREQAFTAHAATWLNGERWTDDPLPGKETGKESGRLVTYMEQVRGEPCEHGEPRGSECCPLCRTGA
jgi:hypothetical protein